MNLLDALIGVVDLKNGQAVHAVAGNREHYLPLTVANGPPGDATGLVKHYYALGLRRFYLADLNALCGLRSQQSEIAELLYAMPSVAPETQEVFLDDGTSLLSYVTNFPLRRVISTEACRTPEDWLAAAIRVPSERVVLGLDLNGSQIRSASSSSSSSRDLLTNARPWVHAARASNCRTVLVLDLQFVGAAQGVGTANACRLLSAAEPGFKWLSGGGVRSGDDVQRLRAVGCSGILVGTALHREPLASEIRDAVAEYCRMV